MPVLMQVTASFFVRLWVWVLGVLGLGGLLGRHTDRVRALDTVTATRDQQVDVGPSPASLLLLFPSEGGGGPPPEPPVGLSAFGLRERHMAAVMFQMRR